MSNTGRFVNLASGLGLLGIAVIILMALPASAEEYMDVYVYGDESTVAPEQDIKFTVSVNDYYNGINVKDANVEFSIQKRNDDTYVWMEVKKFGTSKATGNGGNAEFKWSVPGTQAEGYYRGLANVSKFEYYDASGSDTFYVENWILEIFTQSNVYVGGTEVTVFYNLYKVKNGAGVNQADYHWIAYMDYWQGEDKIDEASFVSTNSVGTFIVDIPSNASTNGYYNILCWANSTDKSKTTEDSTTFEVSSNVYLSLSAGGYYVAGDIVPVSVSASIGGLSYTPIQGHTVKIIVEEDGDELSQYSTNLTTDAYGQVEHILTLDENIESGTSYRIIASISLGGEFDDSDTIYITEAGEETMYLQLQTDKDVYTSGDTITVIYGLTLGGNQVQDAHIYWRAYYNNYYFDHGRLSTALPEPFSSSFTLTVPTNMEEGTIDIQATATNSTGDKVSTTESISVRYANLIVVPVTATFSPGDTLTVRHYLVKAADASFIQNAHFYWEVTDNYGATVVKNDRIEVSGTGSFTFTVPRKGVAPGRYDISVQATDSTGRFYSEEISINKAGGFMLHLSFDKEVYHPGDTVEISYEFIGRSPDDNFRYAEIAYGHGLVFTASDLKLTFTTSAEGTLEYTLPNNLGESNVFFVVSGEVNGGSSTTTYSTISVKEDKIMNNINSKLFGFDGGTPLPLISLLIAIIALVFSVLSWRGDSHYPVPSKTFSVPASSTSLDDLLGKSVREAETLYTSQNPAQPQTDEEFGALPAGAYYINPGDGKIHRK